MNELLTKLLEADVLSEDTRKELEQAFEQRLTEATEQARQEAYTAVTAELNEQWIGERDTLIEALDARVTEALTAELKELREDVERFRDLEVEYNARLVEARAEMTSRVQSDIEQLIECLNSWVEIRLTAELNELREDIQEVRKQEFGRRVFESFMDEFKTHYISEDSSTARLQEVEAKLVEAQAAMKASADKAASLERKMVMEQILSPLSGRAREVMEAILKTVETPMLESTYATYVGRVLKETVETAPSKSEKENKVLAEGKTTVGGVVKNGNGATEGTNPDIVTESFKTTAKSDIAQRLAKIAGVNA